MFALWFILGLSHSHPIIRIWLLFYLGSFWRNVNTLHSSGRRQISGAVIPIRPFSYKLLFKSCPSLPVVQWPPANNVGAELVRARVLYLLLFHACPLQSVTARWLLNSFSPSFFLESDGKNVRMKERINSLRSFWLSNKFSLSVS